MRLIDADALGVGHCSDKSLPFEYRLAWNTLVDLINSAPTVDAVEGVRCENCKHFGSGLFKNVCRLHSSESIIFCVEKDYFCANGEIKG